RFRQITQCDIDVIGSSLNSESEVLAVAKSVFDELKIKYTIFVNNRKLLNEILEENKIKNKEQVIKEIDKLDKLTEKEVLDNLKKYNAEKLLSIFKKPESYFKKYNSYKEIKELAKYCRYYGVKFKFLPSLARGLSYYNGNVLEIKSSEIKETIAAGGAYLVNGIQSFGISFGLDRIAKLSKLDAKEKGVLVISLSKDKEAVTLANKLRSSNINTNIMFGKVTKALEYANSYNMKYVIFVGSEEIKKKKFKLKDMKTGKEEYLSEKEMISRLR
ncbi:ATP phosphoribosyltransferase regulatory subunit, partial [Candidatus Woesearchaeota archaeon]|nr:ATP phosphoribosyltransferase regulatory subunit [Candidatus Woesearchaeota archaeon]